MQPPDGYSLEKCLSASASTDVHAAVRERDGRPVVLKRYLQELTQEGDSRAKREHDVLCQVAGTGVPAVLELTEAEDSPVLVLERAPGIGLASWIGRGLPSPAEFLEVAIQLADVLARL